MAISTNTFRVNPGWARSDVITQMETALTWLGWQAGTETGHIVGLSSFWGGGNTGVTDYYHDVRQKSTSGVGTNASFYVYRNTDGVRLVLINRPGVGYTSGELVVLDGNSIGGISSGAADLSFKVCVDETVTGGSTISIATTDIFYAGADYIFSFKGSDRNGTLGTGQTHITVREGDIVSIGNSYNSAYPPVLVNPLPRNPNNASRDRSMISGQRTGGPSLNNFIIFRPKIGQAGIYHFKSTSGTLGPELGRLIVEPWNGNPGDRTLVGIGSTNTFWDKNLNTTYPWGVQNHKIQDNKRYGSTYRIFREYTAGYLDIVTCSGYSSYYGGEYYGNSDNGNTDTSDYHGGTASPKRPAGSSNLDFPAYTAYDITDSSLSLAEYASVTSQIARLATINHGTNYGFNLDLNVFKSNLDPRFSVFSYRASNLSSTHLTTNTFDTWFFHNFTTDIWDLDHVFLGGMTMIYPTTGNTTYPALKFRTYLSSKDPDNSNAGAKRTAEFPYQDNRGYSSNSDNYVDWFIESTAYPFDMTPTTTRMYYRSNDSAFTYGGGYPNNDGGNDRVSPDANFNAVIKGLPLSGCLLPVPYYLPDDFVLIQFYYNAANANIQQGDTITISPSEVYTVITGSYNQTTVTRGILFCARTV
jgi:hypothetical protein